MRVSTYSVVSSAVIFMTWTNLFNDYVAKLGSKLSPHKSVGKPRVPSYQSLDDA